MSQDLIILDEEDKHVTFEECVEIIEREEDDCKESAEDELHEVQEAIDDVKEELMMNYVEKKILNQHHEELMKRLDRILKDMGII